MKNKKIEGNIYNIQRNPIILAQIHKCNAHQVKNRLLGFLNVCLSGWKRENTIMTYKYSFNHVEVVNSAANYHNSSSYAKCILLIYLLSYLDTTTYCMEFVSNFNSLHGCGCVSFHNGMGHVHFPNPNTRFYGSDTSVWYCYGKYSKIQYSRNIYGSELGVSLINHDNAEKGLSNDDICFLSFETRKIHTLPIILLQLALEGVDIANVWTLPFSWDVLSAPVFIT